MKCVKCGKCIGVCPVYLIERSEQYSPRGRLLLNDQGYGSAKIACLGCRKCMKICPYSIAVCEVCAPEKKDFKQLVTQNDFINKLFILIYGTEENVSDLKIQYKGKVVDDPLLFDWLKERGIAVDNGGNPSSKKNLDGTLYNPFFQQFLNSKNCKTKAL